MDIVKKAAELTTYYMNCYQSPNWLTTKGINPVYKEIYDRFYEYFYRQLTQTEGDIILGQRIWI